MITPAFAQAAGASGGTNELLIQLVPFGFILIIMYFLILRPQQRKQKEHTNLVSNVRRGDTVYTSGGLVARVTKATDANEVEIEIAPNVKVRLLRQMITNVIAKGEPVPANDEPAKSDGKSDGKADPKAKGGKS